MPSLFGGEEEGVLQTDQRLGLEAEPRNRGLPITGSQSPGPIQTNKQNYLPIFKFESQNSIQVVFICF